MGTLEAGDISLLCVWQSRSVHDAQNAIKQPVRPGCDIQGSASPKVPVHCLDGDFAVHGETTVILNRRRTQLLYQAPHTKEEIYLSQITNLEVGACFHVKMNIYLRSSHATPGFSQQPGIVYQS